MNITYFFHICTCIIFLFKVTFWGVSQPPSGNFKIFFFKNRSVDFFYFKSQSYLYSLLHKVIFLDFSTYFVLRNQTSKFEVCHGGAFESCKSCKIRGVACLKKDPPWPIVVCCRDQHFMFLDSKWHNYNQQLLV